MCVSSVTKNDSFSSMVSYLSICDVINRTYPRRRIYDVKTTLYITFLFTLCCCPFNCVLFTLLIQRAIV